MKESGPFGTTGWEGNPKHSGHVAVVSFCVGAESEKAEKRKDHHTSMV